MQAISNAMISCTTAFHWLFTIYQNVNSRPSSISLYTNTAYKIDGSPWFLNNIISHSSINGNTLHMQGLHMRIYCHSPCYHRLIELASLISGVNRRHYQGRRNSYEDIEIVEQDDTSSFIRLYYYWFIYRC